MAVVRLIPVIISLLLLGAHFSRADMIIPVIVCLLFIPLLFIRRTWVARLIQAVLLLGAAEWIRTTILIVRDRQSAGESWTRLVIILGVVALITGLSALMFQTQTLKKIYRLK